ncbi:MAG: hypothetical protein QXK47_06160 [Candidatus Bathyarchaeia archaeon]
MKILDRNWHDSRYKKQANDKGKSKDQPLVDPLPTLKEKLLARKCRELARQLLKREQRKKRKNARFNLAIVEESRR